MYVTEIFVADYRNLKSQTVAPRQGLNVFMGDNAQGKTNLVESVCLCCLGKSPRTGRDADLIAWGKKQAFVRVKYVCRYGEGEISIRLAEGMRKQISVNSVPVAKTGDLMGYLNCVYFSPDEIKIISQSPSERRRFMDMDLCQTDKNYFYSLVRHNKALAQRNNLLKKCASFEEAKQQLFMWDGIIAAEGARIVVRRKEFCARLKPLAQKAHSKLTLEEDLQIDYVTAIEGNSVKEAEACYLELLQKNAEKDFRLRHTTVGCQRDDVAFSVNGTDVRQFGSQGQLRTTALSLKLAELALFRKIKGEYPVLILDDVLSELDADRQRRLLNFDDRLQILLTTATPVNKKEGATFFSVACGTVSVQK